MTITAVSSTHRHRPHPRHARRWARLLGTVFALLILGMVAWSARTIDWPQVGSALAAYQPLTIALATAAALTSHLLYSLYDRIGMAWGGHRFAARHIMQISFASYAFNLNLGPLIGSLAFRFRMYSRLGLRADAIARVVGMSVVTNWLGYASLGGGVFLLGGIEPPGNWALGRAFFMTLGAVMWLVVATYLAACGFARRRSFSVRGHRFTLPRPRTALTQLAVSCGHWLATAGVLYLLFQQRVGYAEVLSVFLVAAVAGAMAHIPAGLGVLEAVFIALLSPALASHTVIATLLAYRTVYYLLPLALATGLYLRMEMKTAR